MDHPIFYCPKCKVELDQETDYRVGCPHCGLVWVLSISLEKLFSFDTQRKWDGIEWR